MTGTQHNDTEGTYRVWSETYDDDHATRDSREITAVEEIVVRSLLRHLHYRDVLDVATGTGRWAMQLAQAGKRVSAVDDSEPMLAKARAKTAKAGLPVDFRRASVTALPYDDEQFDLVICALALAHVKDLTRASHELVRVLRRGGHVIISDIHPDIQKCWGPNYTLTIGGQNVPFPQYHGEISDYLNGLTAAEAEVLAVIDVPMQQQLGLYPGPFVVLARRR
jgi:ubiquinone/menaquinone biosynthesis C-methylase UbiE